MPRLRPQLIVIALFCLVATPVRIVLVGQMGPVGIMLASLIRYVLTVASPYVILLRPIWIVRLRT